MVPIWLFHISSNDSLGGTSKCVAVCLRWLFDLMYSVKVTLTCMLFQVLTIYSRLARFPDSNIQCLWDISKCYIFKIWPCPLLRSKLYIHFCFKDKAPFKLNTHKNLELNQPGNILDIAVEMETVSTSHFDLLARCQGHMQKTICILSNRTDNTTLYTSFITVLLIVSEI